MKLLYIPNQLPMLFLLVVHDTQGPEAFCHRPESIIDYVASSRKDQNSKYEIVDKS